MQDEEITKKDIGIKTGKHAGIFPTASKTAYGSELEFPKGSTSNTSDTSSFKKFETHKSRSRARDFFLVGGYENLTEYSYVKDSTASSSPGTVKLSAKDLLKDILDDYSSFKEETALSERKNFEPEWEYRTHRQNYLSEVIERELPHRSKHLIKLVMDLSDNEFELISFIPVQTQGLSDEGEYFNEICFENPQFRGFSFVQHWPRISLIATQTSNTSSVSQWAIMAFIATLCDLYQLSDLMGNVEVDISGCTVQTQVLLLPEILSVYCTEHKRCFSCNSMNTIVCFFKHPFQFKEEEVLILLEITKPLVEKGDVTKEAFQKLINSLFYICGKTPLFYAVDNEKVTHALIEAGGDVNITDKDGKTSLFYAVDNGKVTHALIQSGANVNITDKDGKTPLFYAVNNEKVFHALIEAGADVNITDKNGKTPLFYMKYNELLIHALIKAGSNVNIHDTYDKTPLFYVVNNEKVTHALIEAGADVNITDEDGKTPLFYAVNNEKVTHALIEAGADVNRTDKDGKTPLFHAVNNEKVTHALIEAGADVNRTYKDGKTPLFFCIGNKQAFNALITAGANVNISDKDGKTVLFYAKYNENIFQPLIGAGADVNVADKDGRTALFHILTNENLFYALIKAGADVNRTDKDGKPPLFYAVDNEKVTHALIKAGANVNITDKDGRTPLFYAVDNEKVTHALIKAGADVNITDKDGKTPLFYAVYNEKVAHALIEAGADVNITDKDGKTPLFYVRYNEKVTHALIKAGADVNITDKDGKTPLFYAVNNEKVTHELIEAGADVNITDKEGKTVLLHALHGQEGFNNLIQLGSMNVCYNICKMLLENGSSLCETTKAEQSVFHLILSHCQQAILLTDPIQRHGALEGMLEMLKLFCMETNQRKVAVYKRDINLNSPLHFWASLALKASDKYHKKCVSVYSFKNLLEQILNVLLECGVKINDGNENKETPLHVCKTWTAVNLLLDAGAKPYLKDSSGNTPLLAAAKNNTCLKKNSVRLYPDVLEEPKEFWKSVLDKKLDPWTVDQNGESLLSILIKKAAFPLANAFVQVVCEQESMHLDTIVFPLLFAICQAKSTQTERKIVLMETLLRARSPAQERSSNNDTAQEFSYENIYQLPKDSVKPSVHRKIAEHLLSCGPELEASGETSENCPILKDLLSIPIKTGDILPGIYKWETVSLRHKCQLAKVALGLNCQKTGTVCYINDALDNGTFGLVFVGINAEDGMEVAVKRIEQMRITKEKDEEIEHLKLKINCNKIIQCLFHTEDKDFLYVVLELMEGNLDDLLSGRNTFDGIQQIKLCKDILTGLEYLHGHNIIHRGVKPGNILYQVLPSGLNLKLAFFGLRCQMSDQCTFTYSKQTVIADRCWMAPEVLKSQSEHSASSDIFCCGLVVHYILSFKKHPFAPRYSSNNGPLAMSIKTVDNIVNDQIELDGNISTEGHVLLKQMLDKEKESRPNASQVLSHQFSKITI